MCIILSEDGPLRLKHVAVNSVNKAVLTCICALVGFLSKIVTLVQEYEREKQRIFNSVFFFPEDHGICEIMWKKCVTAKQATDNK